MLEEWFAFWVSYFYVLLLTVVFTFIGVLGRFLRDMKKKQIRFSLRAFLVEFLISLSLTVILALVCIANGIDILTTCVVVGVGGHFGTNGVIKLICHYIKIDCGSLVDGDNEKSNNNTK